MNKMKYQTLLKVKPSPLKIKYNDKFLLIGSCFSENIGQRLTEGKFETLINPFGILYNPYSIKHIFHLLKICQTKESLYKEISALTIEKGSRVFNYLFHSDIVAKSREELYEMIFDKFLMLKQFLIKRPIIIITFGSSIIYQLRSDENQIVSNCHKQHAQFFEKKEMSIEKIKKVLTSLKKIIIDLTDDNYRLCLTVSPVRHTKEGLVANSISKAKLLAAIGESFDFCTAENMTEYFPSFEIMNDELRDYRFYEKDLIHPNEVAIDRIWEVFQETYFTKDTIRLYSKWMKTKRSLDHKPFNKEGEDYKKFLLQLRDQLKDLESDLKISSEIEKVDCLLQGFKG